MKPAIDIIIAKFGGIRPFARAISKTASTVQYWKEQGFLPRTDREAVGGALVAVGLTRRESDRLTEKAVAGLEAKDGAEPPPADTGRATTAA